MLLYNDYFFVFVEKTHSFSEIKYNNYLYCDENYDMGREY